MSWSVYVNTIKGKTSALSVEPSHTILSFKNAIEQQTGVQVHLQKLLFNGRHLEDNQATLVSYGVHNWSKVILVPQAEPEGGCSDVVIKTLSGKTIVVQAKLSDTVEEICTKIQKQEGMASEQQQLIYGGKVLDWDTRLDNYNIQHGSSLHVICALAQRKVFFRIFASHGDCKTRVVPLTVLLSDPVEKVSRKLAEKFELPADQQKLLFKGVCLEKDKSLGHYSITSGSIIDVWVKDNAQSPPQETVILQDLFIRTPIGKVVSVKFSPSDTIRSIKEKVHAKVAVEPERQVLLFAGNPLNDGATLSSYNISTESTFQLVLLPESDNTVQMFVRTVAGTTFAMDVNVSDSVGDVKAKIERLKGIPRTQQDLLFRGELLSDYSKLSDYNIETESTFYLTLCRTEETLCLSVKTPKKTLDIQVPLGSTVRAIKEEVFAAEKVSVELQKLFLGNVELKDEESLSNYDISNGHLLHLQIESPVPPQVVYVRNLLGKTIAVGVSFTDKVKMLKEKVFAAEGIPVEHQKLILHGMDLDDEESLEHYKIEQESNLQLALVVPEEEAVSPLRINVSIPTPTPGEWKNLAVEISAGSRVRDLKDKLHEITRIPPNEQVLFSGSQELRDDNATLEFYRITTHSLLQLRVGRHDKTIFIKNLKHTINLEVSLGDTVFSVKSRISKKEGIHPTRQRLLYQGRELEDDKVLVECKIDHGSTVILSVREVPMCPKIAVKLPSCDSFSVDMYPGDTIADVKHAVQRVKHVPADRQIVLSENGSILCDDADAIASGESLSMELRPVRVSVVVSRYDHHCKARIVSVYSVTTVNDLQEEVEAALDVPRSMLKFFHKGVMLTNELSHLVEEDSVIMLDVTVPVGEPLSGEFDGSHHVFEQEKRSIRVILPSNTSILSFTVHEMALSNHKFKMPPSVTRYSQVYELSCTHSNPSNTSAEIAIPYEQGPGSGASFYLANKIPHWECDLTPVYAFHDTKKGTFDTIQSIGSCCVQNFNCYICVCSEL